MQYIVVVQVFNHKMHHDAKISLVLTNEQAYWIIKISLRLCPPHISSVCHI